MAQTARSVLQRRPSQQIDSMAQNHVVRDDHFWLTTRPATRTSADPDKPKRKDGHEIRAGSASNASHARGERGRQEAGSVGGRLNPGRPAKAHQAAFITSKTLWQGWTPCPPLGRAPRRGPPVRGAGALALAPAETLQVHQAHQAGLLAPHGRPKGCPSAVPP